MELGGWGFTQSRVPTWDLSVVLEGLSLVPFEFLNEVYEKFIFFKR